MKKTNENKNVPLKGKILIGIGFASVISSILVTEFLPTNNWINDAVFFGCFGLGILLFILGQRYYPNTDEYCCSECGHSYVPEMKSTFRGKKQLHCPACQKHTTHTYVLPEKLRKHLKTN